MNLKETARRLTRKISALALAIRHEETPWYAKILACVTVGYALSPIDLIPDFIPVIGYLDDIVILPILIIICLKLIPAEVMAECEEKAEFVWKDGKPVKWYYAIPILVIWGIIIVFICTRFL
jgi:uncharacterized membrane protein YkvA (DUF1232 family)